jgi:hypothetical protein
MVYKQFLSHLIATEPHSTVKRHFLTRLLILQDFIQRGTVPYLMARGDTSFSSLAGTKWKHVSRHKSLDKHITPHIIMLVIQTFYTPVCYEDGKYQNFEG